MGVPLFYRATVEGGRFARARRRGVVTRVDLQGYPITFGGLGISGAVSASAVRAHSLEDIGSCGGRRGLSPLIF
jgi:hypothetical protein